MRTGNLRSRSERDYQALRERRAWEQAEQDKELEAADRLAYDEEAAKLERDQTRTPEAFKVKLPVFAEWRKLTPQNEPDPVLRAAIATNKFLQNQNWRNAQAMAAGVLDDGTLQLLGFDLSVRAEGDMDDMDPAEIGRLHQFRERNPDYDHATHFDALVGFLKRHRLYPSLHNVELAWIGLTALALVPPKPPEPPASERENLNKYGVNLGIERSPEWERQEARKRYYEEVVVKDPETGKSWTQYQIDSHMDADTYRRFFLGRFRTPTVRDVIDPNIK